MQARDTTPQQWLGFVLFLVAVVVTLLVAGVVAANVLFKCGCYGG